MLQVGQTAPCFKGTAVIDNAFKDISLDDYKGKWVVLFFYPLDFTFVCPTEITAFSDRMADFKKLGCEVIGCSVDSKFSHLAWIQTARDKGGLGDLAFPLLADLTKTVGRDYGVLMEAAGIDLRGLFIIDDKGVLQSSMVNNLGVGRNVDEVLRLVAAFQTTAKTGEVCPANWKAGDSTMKPTASATGDYLKNKKAAA